MEREVTRGALLGLASGAAVAALGAWFASKGLLLVRPLLVVWVTTPTLGLFGLLWRAARGTLNGRPWEPLAGIAAWVAASVGVVLVVSVFTNIDLRTVPAFAAPTIDAILTYEADHGIPPASLRRLVPDYLDQLPGTGLWPDPGFDYARRREAAGPPDGDERRLSHSWELSVSFLIGAFPPELRTIRYSPTREYRPRGAETHSPERIGGWILERDCLGEPCARCRY